MDLGGTVAAEVGVLSALPLTTVDASQIAGRRVMAFASIQFNKEPDSILDSFAETLGSEICRSSPANKAAFSVPESMPNSSTADPKL
jgi:hypothetical protein